MAYSSRRAVRGGGGASSFSLTHDESGRQPTGRPPVQQQQPPQGMGQGQQRRQQRYPQQQSQQQQYPPQQHGYPQQQARPQQGKENQQDYGAPPPGSARCATPRLDFNNLKNEQAAEPTPPRKYPESRFEGGAPPPSSSSSQQQYQQAPSQPQPKQQPLAFEKRSTVEYRNSQGVWEPATVTVVGYDEELVPYYSIQLHSDGREKNTVRAKTHERAD